MVYIPQKAPILHQIANFIKAKNTFDEETLHQAKRVMADTMGVALSGVKTNAFNIALQSRELLFGKGSVEVWGTDKQTSLLGAIFYNVLSVSSTDFDEGHRKAVGHPASLVVPVAMALGEYHNKTFKQILEAVIVGYEIGTRFSFARSKEKITTYSSGRWGAIASAASAAYLLELSTEQTMNALSLASVLSPAMLGGSTDVSTGSMSKEGVAWAAQSGLQSALMAQNGFIGPYLFLDEHDDFNHGRLLENLGDSWLINSNYFKPYSCCRWLHPGIHSAYQLKAENDLNPSGIERIEVGVFQRAMALISSKYPENEIQAQFHLPYVVATALIYDQISPKQFSPSHLKNSEVIQLIDKISLKETPNFTSQFPAKLPTSVSIHMQSEQVYTKTVDTSPWEANDPPTDQELFEKAISQGGEQAAKMWDSVFAE